MARSRPAIKPLPWASPEAAAGRAAEMPPVAAAVADRAVEWAGRAVAWVGLAAEWAARAAEWADRVVAWVGLAVAWASAEAVAGPAADPPVDAEASLPRGWP